MQTDVAILRVMCSPQEMNQVWVVPVMNHRSAETKKHWDRVLGLSRADLKYSLEECQRKTINQSQTEQEFLTRSAIMRLVVRSRTLDNDLLKL